MNKEIENNYIAHIYSHYTYRCIYYDDKTHYSEVLFFFFFTFLKYLNELSAAIIPIYIVT